MKNLPQSISIFKLNEEDQTIRYRKMYYDEVRWEKEDIFKFLIIILIPISFLLLALGLKFHIFTLLCLSYIFFGFTFLTIVTFVITGAFIKSKLWAEKVAETDTLKYQLLKAMYQMSRANLWFKLNTIRKKENTTIAEQEFYEKYKELYDNEYVEYLDIPLCGVLSE